MWLSHLLVQSGYVHPKPGAKSASPSLVSTDSSFKSSSSILDSITLSRQLSFVQQNGQCIVTKLDILHTEFHDFENLAFSETWLNPAISNDKLILQPIKQPERKDRKADSDKGVML